MDSPLVAIGIVTMPGARSIGRQVQIHRTWGSLMPDDLVSIRFVLGCNEGIPSARIRKLPHAALVVCSEFEAEHPKTIEWFEKALTLFPRTPWICHADDDSYVQTRVLHTELSQIVPTREAYGLFYVGKAWDSEAELNSSGLYLGTVAEENVDPAKSLGMPQLELLAARRGNRRMQSVLRSLRESEGIPGLTPTIGFRFPFLQGGFYALSRDLITLLSPTARELWERHSTVLRTRKLGEDAFVFYALQRASSLANVSYRIRHLSWSRFHFLPQHAATHAKTSGASTMGWVYPSHDSSSVVHWIKHGDMELVHNVTLLQREPIFAPFVFGWDGRSARLTHEATHQLARWSIYRKCCWIFGCHAPYRSGGDLKACFLAKSADLSPEALRRISTAPPFNDKEFLGSQRFPI